jgi:tetratricopeptide (TPR) repeat protein
MASYVTVVRNASFMLQAGIPDVEGESARIAVEYAMAHRFLLKSAVVLLPVFLSTPAWASPQQSASLTNAETNTPGVAARTTTQVTGHVFSFPVASKSVEAQKLMETALYQYENVLLDKSVQTARKATEKDPQFALAYALWSFAARQNQPNPEAARKAELFAVRAPAEEQLLVKFFVAVQKSDMLPAITAMNDLLAHFPKDRHALYLTAEWLYNEQDYDRSVSMLEQIIKQDPNFAPAYNMLGYAKVGTGVPDPIKAIAYLTKYAELEAGQPNPEDSLGEVYRFAGDDQGSLEHYRTALKFSPGFITSQTGLGDTYSLMGDFNNATVEYNKALAISTNNRDRLHAEFQKALMKFWAGKSMDGLQALADVERKAQAVHEPYALFEIQEAEALLALTPMERVAKLHEMARTYGSPVEGMSESDRNPSLAAIWRDEVRIRVEQNQTEATVDILQKLDRLAAQSRDLIVENYYESARGYVYFAQKDYENAADELSADPHSPLAIKWLGAAREKLGDRNGAEAAQLRLKYLRAPTAEWYLATHPGSSSLVSRN